MKNLSRIPLVEVKRISRCLLIFGFILGLGTSVCAQLQEVPKYCKNIERADRTSISVSEFTFSARGGYGANAGVGLKKMLSNALVECGCFRVVERDQLKKILAEQELNLSGGVRRGTGSSTGKLTGAQVTVLADVTEFKEKESGFGIGGFAKSLGIGGVGKTTAHIGIVLQVVDTETGETLISKSINHKKSSVGLAAGTGVAGVIAGGLFYKSQAMEDAIEEAIIDILGYVAQEKSILPTGNGNATAKADAYGIGGGITVKPEECALLRGSLKPKIMVIIPEVHIQRVIPDPAGETEIIRKLKMFGYDVIDPGQIERIRKQEAFNQALDAGDNSSLADFGKQMDADILIVGEAFSEDATRLNNMFSCRARVEARAIDVNSGSILATNGAHGSGLDIATNVAAKAALRDAGTLMADYFINELCDATLTNLPSEGRRDLGILVSNMTFTQYRSFMKKMDQATWGTVIKKDYNKNILKMILRSSEVTDDLADRIIDMSGGLAQIVSASGNKIQAKYK